MIHGIHQAFFVLGGLTVLSTIVFRELKSDDGEAVSQHKVLAARRVTERQSWRGHHVVCRLRTVLELDRPRKTMACPTPNLLNSYFLDTCTSGALWKMRLRR